MSDLGPNISTENNLNLVRASSISKMFQQQDNSQSEWSIVNEQRENDGKDHATVQVMGMGWQPNENQYGNVTMSIKYAKCCYFII